jgi:hypothetical protein
MTTRDVGRSVARFITELDQFPPGPPPHPLEVTCLQSGDGRSTLAEIIHIQFVYPHPPPDFGSQVSVKRSAPSSQTTHPPAASPSVRGAAVRCLA